MLQQLAATKIILDEFADVAMLDEVHGLFSAGQIDEGMGVLLPALQTRRQELNDDAWGEFARVCLDHPLCQLLHEDPFTYRAFSKPRGYAGDAAMIDLIYRKGAGVAGLTPLGSRLHEWAVNHGAFRSVQERRDLLATLIDQIAAERTMPRILALACGHLREAQRSDAVRDRAVREIVAVDQVYLILISGPTKVHLIYNFNKGFR